MVVEPDYSIVKTTPKDTADVLQFILKDFLYTEPLNAAVGLKTEEAQAFFAEIVEAGLSCPINYIVRDKEGRVVALRWACIVHREDAANDYTFESSSENWKVGEIQRLLSSIEKKIWDVAPKNVNCLLSWLIISVDQSFTRRGIAHKLLTYQLEEAKQIGCQGLITTASAFNSQQLFKKLGYDEVHAVQLADWKDKDGNQIFKCLDRTSKASLVMKLF